MEENTTCDVKSEEKEESVHLKLYENVRSDIVEKPTTTDNQIIIYEYRDEVTDSIVLASTTGRKQLEHFSRHVFNSNYSTNDSVRYSERTVDISDSETYLPLWKSERFLCSAKSFSGEWQPKGQKGKVTFENTIDSSVQRMNVRQICMCLYMSVSACLS